MPSENNNDNTNKGNHRGSKPSRRRQGPHDAKKKNEPSSTTSGGQCLLVLHGNRQTGQLLLGRLDKLQRRVLKEFQLDCVAPDAPLLHPEDANLRTWWNREENFYQGLQQSLETLKSSEQLKDRQVVGILGFSQGARLAHLIALLHTQDRQTWFPTLKFVIIAAGYDAPIPDGFPSIPASKILLDSLHVWGMADPLISPDQSQAVTTFYESPETHVHDGKHYVPMKAPDVEIFVNFIRKSLGVKNDDNSASKAQIETATPAHVQASPATISPSVPAVSPPQISQQVPDEETAIMQQEEVQALEAIFPDELILKSSKKEKNCEEVYDHPIVYHFKLLPSEDVDIAETNWPSRPLTLEATYPYNYPNEKIPIFRLIHENNIYEFPSARMEILMKTIKDCANGELGMPSVLSCIYAARDYLDAPPSVTEATSAPSGVEGKEADESNDATNNNAEQALSTTTALKTSTPEQINVCNLEGLNIAEEILRRPPSTSQTTVNVSSNKKGGSLTYTIGLVGKPSAGKSTFFNAATAFSRQRGDNEGDSGLGGASMAPHPFTTINPNIGYCLVPAPAGSCPEDDAEQSHAYSYGSTHGRDPQGRRFLPVLLKDVAGLVPGAYQGRGRGNQFLNDLCDATVLIHVVDASGTADAQGNTTVTDGDESAYTNPLDDLAWIRNELVEWVHTNLMAKWETIQRKGRSKVRMRVHTFA
jgi:predicted esterase